MPDEEIGRRLGRELVDDTLKAIAGMPGRVSDLDRQIAQLEERVQANRERIAQIEGELDAIERRLGQRLDSTETRIDREVQNKREWSRGLTFAVIGVAGSLIVVAVTAVGKALGWF